MFQKASLNRYIASANYARVPKNLRYKYQSKDYRFLIYEKIKDLIVTMQNFKKYSEK